MLSNKIKFPLICLLLLNCVGFSVKTQIQSSDEVTLNVTVVDKKSIFIKNLTASNFKIFNGKTEQEIKSIAQEDIPSSIGILVDLSASTESSDRLLSMQKGLVQFVKQSNPLNEYFIIGFNEQPKIVLDNTQDKKEVLRILETLSKAKPSKNTAFYDSLYQSVEKISTSKFEKRILLLITDGQDNQSKKEYKDVKDILQKKNVIVYAVDVFSSFSGSGEEALGHAILDNICNITGGLSLYPRTEQEVGEIFTYAANDLRNQYKIIFDLRSHKRDRGWNKIKVELVGDENLRKSKVRTRKGFYILE